MSWEEERVSDFIRRAVFWIVGIVGAILLFAVVWAVTVDRYQSYEPISKGKMLKGGAVKTPWPQAVYFRVGIVCLDLPTLWIDFRREGTCNINAWLFGSPPDFRFTSDEFVLRDVEDNFQRISWYAYEPKEDYGRSANIVYKFSQPPKTLSLTVPPIEVAGVVYAIPELRFKYKETMGFWRFVIRL